MGLKRWWGRLWTRTDWIGLIATILAALTLLAFTKWAALVIGELQSLIEQRTLAYMADDPDLIWGICAKTPLQARPEGDILFWNFMTTCDDIHLEAFKRHTQDGLVIVNPYTTFAFLNNLTRKAPRYCYDVNIEAKHPSKGGINCTAFFEDVLKRGEWANDDYMTLPDVQIYGNDYLRDVISLPVDEATHKIVFRMAIWNTSVAMVVDDADWFSRDGNADELIMKHQSAVCHKPIPEGEIPPHWISSYRCLDVGVENSFWDDYTAILLQIRTKAAVHPLRSLGISGSYDDWYAIYTGMLGGLFGSCATVLALILVALLGATFNLAGHHEPLKPAEVVARQTKKDEKEKRLEAMSHGLETMSHRMEAVYASLVGANMTCTVLVDQQDDHEEE